MTPVALTIAGSDPSGGAGIQADLKTFHQWGVYGTSVLTLVTVQNTQKMEAVHVQTPELVAAQMDAVLEDFTPNAAKTGALGGRAVIEVIAERARHFSFPLVVDPVLESKHGGCLLKKEDVPVLIQKLLPHAACVTPNLEEARILSGRAVSDAATALEAAKAIRDLGPRAVLIKGGHLEEKSEAVDYLYFEGRMHVFSGLRIPTPHTHGTGCTYSAAVTAFLAKGKNLPEAVGLAKKYITAAIAANPGLGRGAGPVGHHAPAGDVLNQEER